MSKDTICSHAHATCGCAYTRTRLLRGLAWHPGHPQVPPPPLRSASISFAQLALISEAPLHLCQPTLPRPHAPTPVSTPDPRALTTCAAHLRMSCTDSSSSGLEQGPQCSHRSSTSTRLPAHMHAGVIVGGGTAPWPAGAARRRHPALLGTRRHGRTRTPTNTPHLHALLHNKSTIAARGTPRVH